MRDRTAGLAAAALPVAVAADWLVSAWDQQQNVAPSRTITTMPEQPRRPAPLRGSGQPGVLYHFGQFGPGDGRQLGRPNQYGQMAIEMAGGEERRSRILNEGKLVAFGLEGLPFGPSILVT